MNNYDDIFYKNEIAKRRKMLFSFYKHSNEVQFEFLSVLSKHIKDQDNILDIGTGDGYILKEIYEHFHSLKLHLTGIDNSSIMLRHAFYSPNIKYICCDNEKTPFSDETFDLITAKNVTRFNSKEIYRILRKGGFFVMREYSEGKGLVEVSNMFKNRLIRSRVASFYKLQLKKAGFYIKKISGDDPFITIQDYSNLGNYHSCFLIDSKGDVISQGYSQDDCISVGNILTDGLKKCWNSPVFNHKRHFLQYAYMFNYYM